MARIPQAIAASFAGAVCACAVLAACAVPTASAYGPRARALDRSAPRCAGANLRPNAFDLARIRAATLCLVNRERVRHGERPLRPNRLLRRAAQAHSESMARFGYFSHVGPRGGTPLARMRAAGYVSSARARYVVGENIAWGTLRLSTPRAIVAAWMASPPHRANILEALYRETAIGVSPHLLSSFSDGQAGAVYTEDFGAIRR